VPGKNSPSALGSSPVEDYLERILELINSGLCRVVDIASALNFQASVTNMVQRPDADGLLKTENIAAWF
jgi:Mn-dependent DtxR family transcriptional regulator